MSVPATFARRVISCERVTVLFIPQSFLKQSAGMELYFNFRREHHAVSCRQIVDNLFFVLDGHKGAEGRYRNAVEFGTAIAKNHGETFDQGIDVMVARIDISYKHPLRGSDRFVVKVAYEREGVKLVFFEDIYKLPEQTLCARGRIEAICLQNGKLTRGELFDTIFIDKVKKKQE